MNTIDLQTNRKHLLFSYIVAFLLLILPFWGLHYISDWDAYNYFFTNPSASRDYFFSVLANLFRENGLDFESLYRFNIFLIGISYLWLFRKTNADLIVLAIVAIFFNYVAIGNQIRFFLAYPCCLLSFYYFINKKYWICFVLLTFSIINHKTVIILFATLATTNILLYKFSPTKQIIYIIVANFAMFFMLNYTLSFDEKYTDYLSSNRISSLAGGAFNVFPYLFPIYYTFILNRMIRKFNCGLAANKLYKFLYSSAIATCIFLVSGLQVQVLSNRFIVSFLPIWISLFSFVYTNTPRVVGLKAKKYILYTVLIVFLWIFVVKPSLGYNGYINEAILMISSYSL